MNELSLIKCFKYYNSNIEENIYYCLYSYNNYFYIISLDNNKKDIEIIKKEEKEFFVKINKVYELLLNNFSKIFNVNICDIYSNLNYVEQKELNEKIKKELK